MTSEDPLPKALALHHAGNFSEAEKLYKEILAADALNANVVSLLGTLCFQQGKFLEAIDLLLKAIGLDAVNVEAYNNLASVLNHLKRYSDALIIYNKIIAFSPDNAAAYSNRGNVFNHLKQYSEALPSFEKALALNPGYAEAYYGLGTALNYLDRYSEALVFFDKAIALNPDYADAYNNRGVALDCLQRYEEALASYDKAITLKPGYAEAHSNRGSALDHSGRYNEAQISYDKALAADPASAAIHSNRGRNLFQLGQHGAALASYEKAIEINPGYAGAHWNKSIAKLTLGEYEEGWKLYEWRWKRTDTDMVLRPFSQPLWLGKEPLVGKSILLYAEQGNGDTLQFCRYAPMVAALGARVILEVPGEMIGLLSTLKGDIQLVAQGRGLPEFDYHTPLMSLPLAFGTTLATIPPAAYLAPPQEFIEKWRPLLDEKLGKSFRVGLCWAGGQRPNRPGCVNIDPLRSLHFNQFKPFLDSPNASFISLQLGSPRHENDDARVHDISSGLKSWADTGAVVSLLDLVVSVDTSVVHLAGAIGTRSFLLNRYDTCWRWLLDRDDSPWYPSLTQFRQKKPGEWHEVIANTRLALDSVIASAG